MPPRSKPLKPTSTGISAVDELSTNETPTLDDYLRAVSEYVHRVPSLTSGPIKSAQIALSAGLGRCMKAALEARVPSMRIHAGEVNVAGALRTTRADVSEAHPLDGLRLAVEIKPVNLAVSRAVWNRFGDVRAFAVNIHLKFPFAVVAGVLVLPTWESRKALSSAVVAGEIQPDEDAADTDNLEPSETQAIEDNTGGERKPTDRGRVSTTKLIDRLVRRLLRTRRRDTEADPPHLLEAVAVIVYDPDTALLHPEMPPAGSGLRWHEAIESIANTYELRFE